MQRLTALFAAAFLLAVSSLTTPDSLTHANLQPSASFSVFPRDSGEPTDREPEQYQGSFLDTTLSSMLDRLGVTVFPEDQVFAFPDPSFGVGSQIKVFRALPVLLTDAGSTKLVRTWKYTVQELLDEQRIELGPKDQISIPLDSSLPAQPTAIDLVITRVAERSVTTYSAIEFTTTYQDDPKLEIGKTVVKTEGKVGSLATTYLVRYEDGVEVARTVSGTAVVQKPVAKVILRGTKPKVVYLSTGLYKTFMNEAAERYNVPADKLNSLMLCESGGNTNAYNAAGPYYGLFQFSKSAWESTAFSANSIYDARSQIMAAASLWPQRSWRWPACSKRLGL